MFSLLNNQLENQNENLILQLNGTEELTTNQKQEIFELNKLNEINEIRENFISILKKNNAQDLDHDHHGLVNDQTMKKGGDHIDIFPDHLEAQNAADCQFPDHLEAQGAADYLDHEIMDKAFDNNSVISVDDSMNESIEHAQITHNDSDDALRDSERKNEIQNHLIQSISNCIELISKLSSLLDFESPPLIQESQSTFNQDIAFYSRTNEDVMHNHQQEHFHLYYSILLYIIDSCMKFTNTSIVEKKISLSLKSIILNNDDYEIDSNQTPNQNQNTIDTYLILFLYFLIQELPISILANRRLDLAVLEFSIQYHFLNDREAMENIMSDESIEEIFYNHYKKIHKDQIDLVKVIKESKLFTPVLPLGDSKNSIIETFLGNLEEFLKGLYPFLFSTSPLKDFKPSIAPEFNSDKDALLILDLYLSLQFTQSPTLDLAFIQNCDTLLDLLKPIHGHGDMKNRLNGMKMYLLEEHFSSNSLYMRQDIGLDSKLVMDYYTSKSYLSTHISSISRKSLITKRFPESSEKKMICISSSLENESLYHLLKNIFDSFFAIHSVAGTGPMNNKKRKERDEEKTCFMKIKFGGDDIHDEEDEGEMEVDSSAEVSKQNIVDLVVDPKSSSITNDENIAKEIGNNAEKNSMESSAAVTEDKENDQVPLKLKDGNQDQDILVIQETPATKKRKRFEKSRTSTRLKGDLGDVPATPQSNIPVFSNERPSKSAIQGLDFINDYLPANILSHHRVIVSKNDVNLFPLLSEDQSSAQNSNEISSSGRKHNFIDCPSLLERVEKDLVSPPKSNPSAATTVSGKKGRPAKNTEKASGQYILVDWIFKASKRGSPPTALLLQEGEESLLPKFYSYVNEKVASSNNTSLVIPQSLFFIHLTSFLLSFPARELLMDEFTRKLLIVGIQSATKFSSLNIPSLFEHEIFFDQAAPIDRLFQNQNEAVLNLFTVCEIFVDCLTDRNGSVALDIHEELGIIDAGSGNTSGNALLSSSKFHLFTNFFMVLKKVLSDFGDSDLINSKLIARGFWIQARACEIEGDAVGAVEALHSCLKIFEKIELEEGDGNGDIVIEIPHCGREAIISREAIQDKIDYFELKVKIEETVFFFNNDEKELVVERLEPLFLHSASPITDMRCRGREIVRKMPPEKRLEFLKLLRESSYFLGRFTTWLSTVVECISVTLGTMESGVIDLLDNIENLATFILDLNRFIEDHSHWRDFIKDMNEFTLLIFLCLHVSWKLVNGLKDMPKSSQKAHARKMNLFRNFVSRSWVLFYHTVVDKYDATNDDEVNSLSDILEWVHEKLGSLELCGGDEGALLKVIVSHLSKAGPDYYPEIYQCYSCLYGTVIKIGHGQELEDHHCAKTEFGKEAAELLYKFISPILFERVEANQYRSITKDMTDCLQKVVDVVPRPPIEDRYIAMNTASFERLLKSQINPLVALPDQRQPLAMVDIPDEHVSFSPICKTIFFLYGKIQLHNFFSKPDKSSEYLVSATHHLMNHILLSPNDFKGWVALATAYSSTANEILGRTVIEYREKRKVIDAQRSGFHCYVRSLKLYPTVNLTEVEKLEAAAFLWNNFALHCQSIISAPMESQALKNEMIGKMNEIAGEHKLAIKESDYLQTMTDKMYCVMSMALKQALKIDQNWAYYLSLAHVYRKQEKDSEFVLYLYLKGIKLLPSENITKDQELILDPIYKCVAFILKAYHKNLLLEESAKAAFEALAKIYSPLADNAEKIITGDGSTEEIPLPNDEVLRKGVLFLHAIKRIDKKRWYHRPYYRIAWVWAVIIKDFEKAKEEISLLLNIRSKLRRIWKTDLEANGRHFVYFTQYISFLIDMAQKTCDIPLLVNLCKRLLLEENLVSKIQVRNDARKALLNCIISLQDNVNDQSFKNLVESVSVIDSDVEKSIIQGYEANESNELFRLCIVCDLKRSRKQCEVALEKFILNLYSKLYLQALGPVKLKKPQVASEKEIKMAGKIMQRALHLTKSLSPKESKVGTLE